MSETDVIKIPVQVLKDECLSPNQYCTLYLLSERRANEVYSLILPSKQEVQHLVEQGYCSVNAFDSIEGLDNLPDEVKLNLTDKGYQVFLADRSLDSKKWEEFKSLYPKKSGERALHDNLARNKAVYLKLIKSDTEYNNIIKGLKNEIKARNKAKLKGEFFPEWRMMSTWLNNKSYTLYMDYQVETKEEGGSESSI